MTNTPIPAQEDGGATILEIGQQPDAWREVAARTDDAQHRASCATSSRRHDLRVILTGAGSSAFAGEIAAPALRRHLDRRVDAVATTDIVASPLDHLERHTPTLLVSFGRSGNSPESVATTALADELVDDVWHLILTCDRDGELGRAHSGPGQLAGRLHAGAHQRQRLRDDLEPHLDVVVLPAGARPGRSRPTPRPSPWPPSTS